MSRWLGASHLIVLAVIAVAAAACGQAGSPTAAPVAGASTSQAGTPDTGGGGASSLKACDLLSDEDIEEITDAAVGSKDDDVADTVYANHCRWTLETGEINLGVVSPGGRAFYDKRIGIMNGLEPVQGLPADIATRQKMTGSIFAVKGDTVIDVFTVGVTAPDEDLVTRVLENLGG